MSVRRDVTHAQNMVSRYRGLKNPARYSLLAKFMIQPLGNQSELISRQHLNLIGSIIFIEQRNKRISNHVSPDSEARGDDEILFYSTFLIF
ncbi:hypothetical protein SDC9_181106 [bioreactor metagenome]|uniref:Uncharacterized protein n=1 Tax=bioreactor metagenome TaxID=1076179 RepID=A0A645H3N7_9ZZZZ